jgi:Spy/CpxP family protein refolding chaperone
MIHRKFLSSLSAAALLLAAGPALAKGRHGHGMLQARLEKHLEELGLEPERLEAVRALLDASRQAHEQHREQMRAAFDEMHALLDQDLPDEAAVMSQVERIGELRTEGHKAMLHTLLAVRAELTPEQRAALREKMREDMARRWKHRHGEGAPDAP